MMGRLGAYPEEFGVKYALWVLLLCPLAVAAPCPKVEARDNDALMHIEQTWARALEQRDTASLSCILADEFEDAGPGGGHDRPPPRPLTKNTRHQPPPAP